MRENPDIAVLLGNGKSISNYTKQYFEDLFSRVDVISISGAFKLWNEYGIFPKYHYFGREMFDIWDSDELDRFFESAEKAGTTVFVKDFEYVKYHTYSNVVQLRMLPLPVMSPDLNKWYHAFEYDLMLMEDVLIEEVGGAEAAALVIENLSDNVDERLNWKGLLKMVRGSLIFGNDDYIPEDLDRFISVLAWPKSFYEFYYEIGHSGAVAARLLQLLGYKTTLLLGCDSKYVVKPDGTVDIVATHGIKNVFNGKSYHLSRDVDCEDCQTEEALNTLMHNAWDVLKDAIEYNQLDYNIINCTENSALEVFSKSNIEQELTKK